MSSQRTYKKLGEVADIYQPKTLSTEMLVSDGKYLVYGANGVIGRYNEFNHEEKELLVTCRGATCGTINVSEPYSWINGNAMVVHITDHDVLFDYMRYVLKGLDWSLIITGAAQPQITRQNLAPVQIPIPSL
jgi:type I restriction enzyme S subunit